MYVIFLPAYTCPSLVSIPNGAITYSRDIASRYAIGTTATFSCDSGYYLSGSSMRNCTESGTMGVWDGSATQCLSECQSINITHNLTVFSVHKFATYNIIHINLLYS